MNTFLATVVIAALAMVLAFGMIGIRMLLVKNGEFRGTCSSNNPVLASKTGTCSVCGGDMAKCESNNKN